MFRSVEFSMKYPELAMPFVRNHAQEMDEAVIQQHIGLYVNDFTLRMGSIGKASITRLFDIATMKGII